MAKQDWRAKRQKAAAAISVSYSKDRQVRVCVLKAIDGDYVFEVYKDLKQFVGDFKASRWLDDVKEVANQLAVRIEPYL
jgi:hypothetical protein